MDTRTMFLIGAIVAVIILLFFYLRNKKPKQENMSPQLENEVEDEAEEVETPLNMDDESQEADEFYVDDEF